MPIKRVSVVLNGKAGALLDQADCHAMLEQALANAGLQAEFIPQDAGTLPERVKLAAESGADAVIVAGGDGTAACAGHALAGTDVPLGILPYGTMNLLANDLGLPIGDLPAALHAVAAGNVRAIDVGEVNGHIFLCASMLGMPTQLGRTREETRGSSLRLWSRMAAAAMRLLRRGHRLRMKVRLDGTPVDVRATSLTITVNAIDETCGRTFGRPVLNGGRLGVYLIQRFGLRDAVRLAVRMALGRWRDDNSVVERHAGAVDIEARHSIHVMNDGELTLLQPPLQYRLRPGALRVLVP